MKKIFIFFILASVLSGCDKDISKEECVNRGGIIREGMPVCTGVKCSIANDNVVCSSNNEVEIGNIKDRFGAKCCKEE